MSGARSTTRPGVALLTALVVVLLLTMFLSELFFATGLELRSLESFKDSAQARRLARSVLKAAEIGLLQDEVEFFSSYRQLQQLMTLSSIPLEGGRLVTLDIVPADSLFNVNELAGLQPEGVQNTARFEVFRNLMAQILVPAEDPSGPSSSVPETLVSQIYAALMDWLDSDDSVASGPDGTPGAEASAYVSEEPEYAPKNGVLDRLQEMRLVRGFREARIPWPEIEKRFIARAKTVNANLYPERLNVNLATREEIVSFLEVHLVENLTVSNAPQGLIQKEINKYAERRQDIANALVPDGQERPIYTDPQIKSTLTKAGVNGNSEASKLFSSISQYYRVVITTEVGDIQARLTTLVFVNRNASNRTGKTAEVQQYFMN
jgi:type II secretory pathway component PulK